MRKVNRTEAIKRLEKCLEKALGELEEAGEIVEQMFVPLVDMDERIPMAEVKGLKDAVGYIRAKVAAVPGEIEVRDEE